VHAGATDDKAHPQRNSSGECSPSDHESEHVGSLWNQFQTRRKACAWTTDPKLFAQVMTETSLNADASVESSDVHSLAKRHVTETVDRCVRVRDRKHCKQTGSIVDPKRWNQEQMFAAARYCDTLPLSAYMGKLRYVPRLVNVVTLAHVAPMPNSGCTLPLSLDHIAKHCPGAYFSPKKFAAVQLAFRTPRCRILIFHTGSLVGTGCCSVTEARLATLLACKHMAKYAGMYMYVDEFEVVNTMGAVSLKATIHCEEFQRGHTHCTMLDRSSFVGMTWRPLDQPISVEIYSTGRANISKAKKYSDLLNGWASLIPKMLRYSSSSEGKVKGDDGLDDDMDDDDSEKDEMDTLFEESTARQKLQKSVFSEEYQRIGKGKRAITSNNNSTSCTKDALYGQEAGGGAGGPSGTSTDALTASFSAPGAFDPLSVGWVASGYGR